MLAKLIANSPGLMRQTLRVAIMELDDRIPSKAFIETLRRWLADLDDLEASGAATSDTREILVELHKLLDKLYTTMAERARKSSQ